jgi:hypothetical protein
MAFTSEGAERDVDIAEPELVLEEDLLVTPQADVIRIIPSRIGVILRVVIVL